MLNVKKIRKDFPQLKSGIIYLDNAASSLTPKPVIDKMLEYYIEYRANIERGLYSSSQRASKEYEDARKVIANFIGAKSKEEIIFVKNATEGVNIVAHSINFKKNDKVVTTLLEHHSNLLPWIRCSELYGVKVEYIKPTTEGFLKLSDFEKAIDDRTKIVAVTHASNVLGVLSPVKEIVEIAHKHGARVLVDGAQSTPHIKINVNKVDCDFFTFSGHKMCGPTGSGVLYMREELMESLTPIYVGGGTVEAVNIDDYRLLKGPSKFEAGTPAIGEVIGLKAAAEYLKSVGLENIEQHEKMLSRKIYDGLVRISGVEVYGPKPEFKIGVTSFNVKNLNPHDLALILDSKAIAVRSGLHCAHPLVKFILGKPQGTVRVSTYLYNTVEEVEKFLSIIEEISRSLE
ncbi:MAG: aminotransferase class V-fold PLP-dependent enzyme [Candidatus Bathyarchaeota archaeon]